MKDLTKGSITKLIFWFALPVFIGSLLQMTYNLVDTKIIGYVLGESSLAAVGSTNSVNTLVIGFLQGLTNGFAVIAAQFFGAGDTANFKRTVAGSFKYGIMISAGLTVVVLIFLRPLLKVLNTPEDLLKEAYDYIFIIFAGMTILMLYNVCAALLRSIGDSFTPLIFLGISVVLNIGGDLFFLKVIPMGVRGAAVATVLSQLIALIACLIYSLKRYNILWIEKKDFKSDASLCGKLMSTLFHGLYEQSCINWLCYIAECNQFIWTGYNSCPYYCKKIIRAFHDDVRCAGNYDGNLLWTESWSRKV